MAKYFAYVMDYPGMKTEEYDRITNEMKLEDRAASGIVFHVASLLPNGMRIFDVWESEEAFKKFLNEKLVPAAMKLGFKTAPMQIWDVYNVIQR